AGLDRADPRFGRALSFSHADFGRLLRDRKIREDPDPHAAAALDVARDRDSGRLDLTGSQASPRSGLQSEVAEFEGVARVGKPAVAALHLVHLAELGFFRLQHRAYL